MSLRQYIVLGCDISPVYTRILIQIQIAMDHIHNYFSTVF